MSDRLVDVDCFCLPTICAVSFLAMYVHQFFHIYAIASLVYYMTRGFEYNKVVFTSAHCYICSAQSDRVGIVRSACSLVYGKS